VRLYIRQPEGNNLRILTATLIALSTLFAGTAFAAQPQATQTHPAVLIEHQRQLREQMPLVVEVTPPGVPKDPSQRCPQWEAKFREYGLPVVAFSYISFRESRCNPHAWNRTLNRNGSQDLGLVQINSSWKTVTKNICGTDITGLFNVDCNLSVARYLYDNGGLRHWSL
jgi:hypothetical protein